MYWLSTLILLLMFLLISASLIFMPYLTRDTVSFGVSVSGEMYHSAPIRALRKRYAWVSGILYSLFLLFCLIGTSTMDSLKQEMVIGWFVGMMVISSIVINLAFHFRMKKYKLDNPIVPTTNQTISIDTKFRQHKLIFSNKWFIIHLVIAVCSTFLALRYYNQFPETLAMKFDFQGNVTRSVDKSYTAVLGINLMQFMMTFLFMFLNRTILKSKQQLNSNNPEISLKQNIIFRRSWSLFIVITGLLMVLLFAFIQLNMIFAYKTEVIGLVSIVIASIIIVAAVSLSFITGQSGNRIGKSSEHVNSHPINDDAHWKLGSFYYNPQDPSIWIEKRSGIGWTINMARPISWIILIGIPTMLISISLLMN
ncbi:hypothetical protein D3C76_962910 [compost metagenome]